MRMEGHVHLPKKREEARGSGKEKTGREGNKARVGVGMGEEEGLSQVTVGSADFTKF